MNPYIQQCVIRRQKVLQRIGQDGIAVLWSASEKQRSGDTCYPYRQDSDFYYLSGFDEPESVLVLDGASGETTLFCREKDPEREIWDGFRYGVLDAKSIFRMDHTFAIQDFPNKIESLLKNHRTLWLLGSDATPQKIDIQKRWFDLRSSVSADIQPLQCADLREIVHAMRMIKDEVELNLLRQAAQISALGHCAAMQKTRAGKWEYQIEGDILSVFYQHNARSVAYNSIVAGGKNACVLHYVHNQSILRDGDLLMIDAGAEYAAYAGDISRTFPVNGRFSPAQKDVYEVVLSVNQKIIEQAKAGITYESLSQSAIELLTQGLIDLKLLSGSLKDLIEQKAYRRFYMHGIGHWLGLDVHDVGPRFVEGKPMVLQEDMCMTVEPGLYIPDDVDIPAELRGMGIRIEDNIIIHKNHAEVYTQEAPKTIADIEQLMS